MRTYLFRFLSLCIVLTLCLPMVACDMQFGGLVGELMEDLNGGSDPSLEGNLGELDTDSIIDVLPDYGYSEEPDIDPIPEMTYPDYSDVPPIEPPVDDTEDFFDTTEPPTTEAPLPDPVTLFSSFDELFTELTGQWANVFAPGQSNTWEGFADVDDYQVESMIARGWTAFFAEQIGQFGYQIDNQEPVYSDAFAVEAEQPVWEFALGMSAKSVSRFTVIVPVRELSGQHTIRILAKNADNCADIITEFTINKAVDPYAPVYFADAAEIADCALGSNGNCHDVAAVKLSADSSFVTVTAGTTGDPYFALINYNHQTPTLGGARYLVVKYRTNVQDSRGEFFLGSGSGPHGLGDHFMFDYVTDGRWQLQIIDLSSVEAVNDSFDLDYLRYDFYGFGDFGKGLSLDVAYIATFKSIEAAELYDAAHPYVNSYRVVMNRAENQDIYMQNWPVAGFVSELCLVEYEQPIYCGNIDLSRWSYAEIEYTTEGSDIIKERFEAASSLAIGFKDQASSYGWANDDNYAGDIAHSEMVFSSQSWASGLRCARIDLSNVTYNGEVWATLHSPEGTPIAITSIIFYE